MHEHPNPSTLVPLLRSRLPQSLPTLSALLTPGEPIKVYTSFDPATSSLCEIEHSLWCVLADLGSQFRFYVNVASVRRDDDLEEVELVQRVVNYALQGSAREGKEAARIGAISDRWTETVETITGIRCISPSRVWTDPSYYARAATQTSTSGREPTEGDGVTAPRGFEFGAAREEHIPAILSTSGVPHLPSYLFTRLSHTSCLFSTGSDSSPTPAPSLIAHVTTHRDGSLGTLYVNPLYRRRGFARLIIRHRLAQMRQSTDERLGYCYVHAENEGSRAVMKSLGWRESEEDVWWDIVDAPEWTSRKPERQRRGSEESTG